MSEHDPIDDAVRDWARSRPGRAPVQSEVEALLDRARGARSGFGWFVRIGLVGAVVAVALVVVGISAGWFVFGPSRSGAPEVVVVPRPVLPAPEPVVWTGRTEVDGDVFEIDGTLRPTEDAGVLALEGTVHVEAATRGPTDLPLIVATETGRVQVVGTVFTVHSEPFAVSVVEGVVAVTLDGVDGPPWRLEAGDRFEDGEVVRAPEPAPTPAPVTPEPTLPEVSALKTLVLRGELDAARAGLAERLAADDRDVEAWTLLARLERRAGQTEAAVTAWMAVQRHGNASAAQQARYEAAVLWLDVGRPTEAVPLLRTFLNTPDPLAPEAGVRLGEALVATGRGAEARSVLETVVSDAPGSDAAQRARAILDTL